MDDKYKFNLILIIISIFSLVNSVEYKINFDGENKTILKIENEKETATMTINCHFPPIYTKLYVEGEKKLNYVISVFTNDKREIRTQLAQSVNNKTVLYLTQKQMESKIIYVDIECSITPCSYDLVISPQDKINLEEGEQLSYYVSEDNTIMDFSIDLYSEKANIWSRGGKSIKNNLSNFLTKSQNENYFLVNDKKVEFTVTGTAGDYINVGSIGFNNEKPNKTLMIDEDTISVFLSKNYFPQACFNFRLREYLDKKYMVFTEGIIYTKILKSFIIKEGNKTDIEIFSNGKFSQEFMTNELDLIEVCYTFPEEEEYQQYNNIEEIIFTFYVTLGRTLNNKFNIYEPQINGQLYERNLIVGEKIGLIGLKPENNFKEINFNLFAKNGFPKMTIYDCDNYPLCLYKEGSLYNGISPKNIDQFTTYSIYTNELKIEYNPINKKQKILVVECNQSSQFIDIFCKFDTLIYSNEDAINIFEEQYLNQYLLEEEVDNFKINFGKESKIVKVNIDIIIYVGDIEIITDSNDGNDYHRYHSANKYFINIVLGKESEKLDDMRFKVKAKKNSYYTVLISFTRKEADSEITNELESGINYLVTIDPSKKEDEQISQKIIKIKNDKANELLPFMVNFYSLNCKLNINKKIKNNDEIVYSSIDKYDYCAEDVLTWNDEDNRYYDDFYEYNIQIEEEDFSSFNGKVCMLYISSIEINKQHEIYNRDIVIPDNTPQQIIFKKSIRHISYSYVQVNNEDNLIIKFNVIHKAQYNVKFFYEFSKRKNFTLYSDKVIYLKHSEWKNECPEKDELCYITIDITLEKTIDINEPVLELLVKSVKADTVIYIPKNLLKIDFIQNKVIQRYYTEVGQNEIGFILGDFYTSNGEIYAKLVKKNLDIIEDNVDWEGKYRFPRTKEESLPYDSFTKKINFSTKGLDCENGCYLLISLQLNEENLNIEQFNNHQLSIIIKSAPFDKKYENIPSIKISTDVYIVGNIGILEDDNYQDYYNLMINYDTDKVVIDLQSETGCILVNIGNDKPTIINNDFKFATNGKNSIINLTKKDLIYKMKEKDPNFEKNNIQNMTLTIGFYTNSIDSVYTTVYSFMVHLGSNSINDIHRVKTNKNILCDTKENLNDINYPYRCLYIIEYNFMEELKNLLIYPILQDKTANYQIYADFIDSYSFEMGSESEIIEKIPTKNSAISTYKTKLNYIYITDGLIDENYLLVNIVTTKNTRIELISSFYTNLNLTTPNPIYPQLFIVKKNNLMTLNFQDEKLIKVNLISIEGNAEIYWEDFQNRYYMEGEDDKLILTSLKSNNKILNIKAIDENIENPFGFLFYLSYTVKSQQNLDPLELGKSANFIYSESDFPIVLYSRLEKIDTNIDIFFTFYELEYKDNNAFYNTPVKASISLVKEKIIKDIKSNIEVNIDFSNSIKFIFDPVFKSGFVKLTKDQIKKFNIEENENPNLYIKLEKNNENQIFKRLNFEVTTNQEGDLVPIKDMIYHYGVLLENENKKEYKLKNEFNSNNVILEFSSSKDTLLFNLTDESGEIQLEKVSEKNKNGKKIIMFKINSDSYEYMKLNIQKKENDNDKIYFIFQYYIIKNNHTYKDYIIENDEINVERKKSKNGINYKISLNCVKDSNNLNINYIVKIVTNEDKNVPKLQSIVLSEGEKQFVKEFKNVVSNNDKIYLELNDVEGIPTYIQVVAQIIDKGINQFLSYKYYELPQDEPLEDSSNSAIIIIIIIIIILIIIILIAAIFIIRRKRNKDLANDINKIDNQGGLLGDDTKKNYELTDTN